MVALPKISATPDGDSWGYVNSRKDRTFRLSIQTGSTLGRHALQQPRSHEDCDEDESCEGNQRGKIGAPEALDQGQCRNGCRDGAAAGDDAPACLGVEGQAADDGKGSEEGEAGRFDESRQAADRGEHGGGYGKREHGTIRDAGFLLVIEHGGSRLPVESSRPRQKLSHAHAPAVPIRVPCGNPPAASPRGLTRECVRTRVSTHVPPPGFDANLKRQTLPPSAMHS